MTDNHPITPPPELVKKWASALAFGGQTDAFTQAARWGADQELEACRLWVSENHSIYDARELKAARRPKPPSLKERIATAIAHGDNSIALALLDEALPD